MMKLLIVSFVTVLALLAGLIMLFGYGGIPIRVDSSFARKASLHYHRDGKNIDIEVTDADDVRALRRMLSGWAAKGVVSCGFFETASITLSSEEKSETFLPALSGDSLVALEDMTWTYLRISDKERRDLDRICRKYGVDFVSRP